MSQDDQILERKIVPAGALIMSEGDSGSAAFLIQSGSVRIYVVRDGREIELGRLGAGKIFGELALVSDNVRTANVKAETDTTLILITRQMLNGKLQRSDPTVRALLTMMMERLKDSNAQKMNVPQTVDAFTAMMNDFYKGLEASLPAARRKTLSVQVRPKIDDLVVALAPFADEEIGD